MELFIPETNIHSLKKLHSCNDKVIFFLLYELNIHRFLKLQNRTITSFMINPDKMY